MTCQEAINWLLQQEQRQRGYAEDWMTKVPSEAILADLSINNANCFSDIRYLIVELIADRDAAIALAHNASEAQIQEWKEKAAKWDEVSNDYPTQEEAEEMHKAFGGPNECTTFGPAALQRQAQRDERRKHDPDYVLPLSEFRAIRDELTAARQQAAEAAALVERMRVAATVARDILWQVTGDLDAGIQLTPKYFLREEWKDVGTNLNKALALTPAAALAEYRERVLEEACKRGEAVLNNRPQETFSDAEAVALAQLVIAEIRAMKEGGK